MKKYLIASIFGLALTTQAAAALPAIGGIYGSSSVYYIVSQSGDNLVITANFFGATPVTSGATANTFEYATTKAPTALGETITASFNSYTNECTYELELTFNAANVLVNNVPGGTCVNKTFSKSYPKVF